ncbi:hypothetical protein [Nocardia huaxiensis]|uniref:DUF8020 domain-containing protein n=1 Tax=Nocardia huaxiensis TaxID=2755382 RepID=A0A7D6ZKP7_9NOCA|nr:hypothetical protein [Nocardia huaxiensis]QLY33027.1 hypothetical protein H0264_13015 [Nocardia huaxiensis]UFS93210.1 hypothetical protein LPY97_20345 [Nocardia huaxiensis]
MKINKFAVSAALLSASLAVTSGIASAAPEVAEDGAINYAATNTESQAIIKTDAGSMVVEDGVFKVKAANGTTVAGTELKFRVDDFEFPIAAEIHDRVATLTPQFDLAHAVYKPVALPYENSAPWKSEYEREQAAWSRMTSTIGMGASIGTLVGGLGGAAIGCVIGGATLGTVTGVLTAMFGALGGVAVGCIIGMSTVGFLGTLLGQIFVTAPVAILAAAQYFTTINQPFTPAAK